MFKVRQPNAKDFQSYSTIGDAIRAGTGNIIAWGDTIDYCCLDVDDITGINLSDSLPTIAPNPAYLWVSKSGRGLHALYGKEGEYNADELAALAILNLRSRYPQLHRFELLKHTFQPPGQYYESSQVVDTRELDRLLGVGETDYDSVEQWLEERGMERGKRYPHEYCPIAPDTKKQRHPVVVYDAGIYCHACNATNGWGWFSFNRVGRSLRFSDYAIAVQNKTHWEHARYILSPLTELPDRLNERIYSSSLVYRHGAEVREECIFWPKRNIMRLGRWWGTDKGELYNSKIDGMLAALPVSQYRDDKGRVKVKADILSKLRQTVDLTDIGYPSVDIVRGCRIYGHWLQSADHTYTTVLCSPLLEKREHEAYRPHYVPEEKRDVEAAWEVLEQVFPNIAHNRACIELLIAAKGTAEGKIGLPPFIYISGVSGAAKTSSVMIAAAICGDVNTSVVWTNTIERVRQGILDGKQRGSFVTLNEILKCASKAGVKFQSAMDDMLNLTPDSVSHQLYIGPVPLGSLPVMVWTDTDVPAEIRDSVQLARRLIHVHLPHKQEWEKSIYETGVHQIERLRVAGIEYTDACNVILSDIIDRFFQHTQDLRGIAKSLGYSLLSEAASEMVLPTLREFFDMVCATPSLDAKHPLAKRWGTEGWVPIDLTQPNAPLTQLWAALHDSESPGSSRRCSEADWPKIIKLDKPIEFQVQYHGTKVVVRFVSQADLGGKWYNRGILDE